ncbi:MAG: amino acid racemase [Clostridia bacterium]|nr:amino acid racemase [Clostridia bacterium]
MINAGKTLGILGGLGPMSSVYFYEMLTRHTLAERDSDHLNILLSSRADTPDRTDFITGRSADNPIYTMLSEVSKLIGAGADIIAIPCNTAHYFYDSISAAASVPIINIIRQTAVFCRREGIKKAGILATEGTVLSGAYSTVFDLAGMECVTPDSEGQREISHIIYGCIKKGTAPDMDSFLRVADDLRRRGCDRIILGCTELSLLKRDGGLDDDIFIDSLEVLAYSAIKMCGKTPVGFDERLMEFKV